ncbi:dna glycosylase [Lucifera butyrica]|uniref:Adenine DNA glycosylase n=1 Tax=Lucifera butyrica TaxID=1351585 RepID=A0A498R926_9FIRM|nr:A/G-specific adenine glycosylase [Lucifera butyrica]VBB06643.1 dna glycosylase [Lucifera butyrica]
MSLAGLLLAWYDANKRELPWRQDKDPYKIWVSEVMLQQTRVEAVKAYFERWLERFPTLEDLAAAAEEEVLHYWQGLGYYSRARNLLKGVREVQAQYNGRIPDTKEKMKTVAGVGDYTAGAIVSIAYNKTATAVDGNVLRVFSRLYCWREDNALSSSKRQITEWVLQNMEVSRPGDYNQAIMDLGATICIPAVPRCSLCPLETVCQARRRGLEQVVPFRRKKMAVKTVRVVAGIVQDGGAFLLRQRPAKGLLAGMWEFPATEIADTETDDFGAYRRMMAEKLGQQVEREGLFWQSRHVFSHRQWDIVFYRCRLIKKGDLPAGKNIVWLEPSAWSRLAFAGPHRQVAEKLEKELQNI